MTHLLDEPPLTQHAPCPRSTLDRARQRRSTVLDGARRCSVALAGVVRGGPRVVVLEEAVHRGVLSVGLRALPDVGALVSPEPHRADLPALRPKERDPARAGVEATDDLHH